MVQPSTPSGFQGKRIASIINPRAANGKWKRRTLLRKYIQEHLPGPIIDSYGNKSETIQKARKLSREYDIIVAAGGDGTIADVIQGISESGNADRVTLGIIPLGSGNAFSKSLGIPRSVRKAVRIIAAGKTREIDLLEIEGIRAAFASVGAVARVTREKQGIKIPGLWGHILAAKIMPRLPQAPQEIEMVEGVDDSGEHFKRRIVRLKLLDCVVTKTPYFGYGWKIAPRAKYDDGYVDIGLFQTSGLKYILLFPLIFFGLYQKTQKHFKAKKVVFRGKDLHIQYHGDLLGVKDKVEVKVLPRALRIIVP